jgi:hypothetical protein
MFLSSNLFCENAKTDRRAGNGNMVCQKGYTKTNKMGLFVKQKGNLSKKISQHFALGKMLTFLGLHD